MKRVKELESLILRHKALYYQGRPEISDHEYDDLEDELKKLSPENPVLSIVGSVPTGSDKVKHDKKMLSLGKTYKIEELENWMEKYAAISMFKIDGVSCSLIYEDGKLTLAKTRGDGSFGENITSKTIWIEDIPKVIDKNIKLEIRGELYCTEEDFIHLSDEMLSLNMDKPTSQRNIVAGFMGRKDNLELCRYLSFQAFDILMDESIKTEEEKMNLLDALGFSIPDFVIHKDNKKLKTVIDDAANFMSKGDYQIDGLVFSYNDLGLHEELGETAHHPRYKMAFKFQGESKNTKIKEIVWSVSRNGICTPVANVEPVELSGAVISRVTLHNYGMVRQFNLKSGDTIEIIRSGEVIPKFLSVVEEAQTDFSHPENCPSCGEKLVIDDIRLVCVNEKCPAVIKESILYFVQKIGIDDLSSKRLDEFINKKLITSIVDLYKLKEEDLLTLDKFKERLATKIISAINKSKNVDFITFMSALGISGGAYNKCEKIYTHGINSLDKLKNLKEEDLLKIESFAEKSSSEFVKSLSERISLIEELEGVGFNFEEKVIADTAIRGKKICITGSLSRKRSEIENDIRDNGGIVVSSVSKNTDYLLTNEASGSSKYKKAISLEIPIISEDDFANLIN